MSVFADGIISYMSTSGMVSADQVDLLPDERLMPFLRDAYAQHTQGFAAMVAAVAALENRGIAFADGREPRHVPHLVKELTRQSLSDCRQLVKVARLLGRRAAGGSCFAEPELPATAAALAEGVSVRGM